MSSIRTAAVTAFEISLQGPKENREKTSSLLVLAKQNTNLQYRITRTTAIANLMKGMYQLKLDPMLRSIVYFWLIS